MTSPKVSYDTETDKLIVHESEKAKLYTQDHEESWHKDKKTKLLVTLCILITEMCERLTYYSIIAGLILYCDTQLGIAQDDASVINQVFSGFVYIIPIIGGFIADSKAGRFKTILVSCCIYMVGVLLLPASAVDYENWGLDGLSKTAMTAIFMVGLVFVALGTGGIKANVGPFGAEQVSALGKDAVQSFFNWFYWVINVGALVAYAGVSYIQQEISFAWGFFVPLASMFVALVIFAAVNSKYVKSKPQGSVLTTAYKICRQGAFKPDPPANEKLPPGSEKQLLASAKQSFGGSFEDHTVDGLVSVIRVIPFCVLVVMYWAIYTQMTNTYFAQSERMDVRLGDGVNMPAAALNVFNTISIIILIPIVDRFVYPCFEKMGKPLTYLKRIGIGMILAAMSVIVAGVVEIYRKEALNEPGGSHLQVLADKNYTASSMSVFIQIPQFTLIGASEIFTSVGSLEFAYNQAPVAMQGLLTGLFLAASGIGNWFSMAVIEIVQEATEADPWWGKEINDTKMEYLMFLFGGLMFLNFLVFCVVARNYEYQDPSKFEKAPGETNLGKDNLGFKGMDDEHQGNGTTKDVDLENPVQAGISGGSNKLPNGN